MWIAWACLLLLEQPGEGLIYSMNWKSFACLPAADLSVYLRLRLTWRRVIWATYPIFLLHVLSIIPTQSAEGSQSADRWENEEPFMHTILKKKVIPLVYSLHVLCGHSLKPTEFHHWHNHTSMTKLHQSESTVTPKFYSWTLAGSNSVWWFADQRRNAIFHWAGKGTR